MNRFAVCFLFLLFIAGCQSKKKKPEVSAAEFFPIPDYIKGEVARLDTSQQTFLKIETTNGRSDTTPIKSSEVKTYAKDFLAVPDITKDDLKDDYNVDHIFDEMQNAFVFTYITNEAHPVKKEFVTVYPEMNEEGKNDIKSVFVEFWQKSGDTSIRKNMLWEAGKQFEINTTHYIDEAEINQKLRVLWNHSK